MKIIYTDENKHPAVITCYHACICIIPKPQRGIIYHNIELPKLSLHIECYDDDLYFDMPESEAIEIIKTLAEKNFADLTKYEARHNLY